METLKIKINQIKRLNLNQTTSCLFLFFSPKFSLTAILKFQVFNTALNKLWKSS